MTVTAETIRRIIHEEIQGPLPQKILETLRTKDEQDFIHEAYLNRLDKLNVYLGRLDQLNVHLESIAESLNSIAVSLRNRNGGGA